MTTYGSWVVAPSNWTLTNSNRTAETLTAATYVFGATPYSFGKRMVSFHIDDPVDGNALVAVGRNDLGTYIAWNQSGSAFSSISSNTIETWGIGDDLDIAVDLTTGLAWFRKNGGNWNNNAGANPATGVGGFSFTPGTDLYPIAYGNAIGSTFTITTGGNSIPSGGFSYWAKSQSLIRSSSIGAYGSRTNTTITAPTGIQDGDILILQHFIGASGTIPSVTPPSGFTQIGTATSVTDGSFNGEMAVYWKRASSESGDYTLTHSSASTKGAIIAVYGARTSGNPISAFSKNTGSGDTTTLTGVTTDYPDTLLLGLTHGWDDLSATTPTTDWAAVAPGDTLFFDEYSLKETAGATGDVAFTNFYTYPWGAFLLAVPSAGTEVSDGSRGRSAARNLLANSRLTNSRFNWLPTALDGVSADVIGTGVETGLEYVDIRFHGTATSEIPFGVYFSAPNPVDGVKVGDILRMSCYTKLVGGDFTNLSYAQFFFDEYSSSAYLASDSPGGSLVSGLATGALNTQRVSDTVTMSQTLVEKVVPYYVINHSAGAIDITVRFAGPQLEFGSTTTDYVSTPTAYAVGSSTAAASGSASGVGAASGVGRSTVSRAGSSSTNKGTATGVGRSTVSRAVSASGIGSASGVGRSTVSRSSTASGTSIVSGIGRSTASSAASSSGVGAATGVGSSVAEASGSATGVGTASGVGRSTTSSIGSSSGSSSTTGVGHSTNVIVELADKVPRGDFSAPNTTKTVSGIPLGGVSPDRIVAIAFVAINGSGSFIIPTSVTIAGVEAVVTGSTSTALIATAPVPTGATASLVVTHSSNISTLFEIASVAVYGASGPNPYDSFATTSTSGQIDVPTHGAIVAVSGDSGSQGTWTGAIELFYDSGNQNEAAEYENSGDTIVNRTIGYSTSNNIVAVSFSPAIWPGVAASSGSSTASGGGDTANSVESGAGDSEGTSSVSGTGSSTTSASGSSSGAAGVSGFGASTAATQGSSSSSSEVGADGTGVVTGQASASGISTASALGSAIAEGAGESQASSTSQSSGQALIDVAGSSSGSGSVSGSGSSTFSGHGQASGASTGSGVGSSIASSLGRSEGTGGALGTGSSLTSSRGVSVGVSTGTGVAIVAPNKPPLAVIQVGGITSRAPIIVGNDPPKIIHVDNRSRSRRIKT